MRFRHVVALLVLLFGFQTVRTYGQVVATWTDSDGYWSNPANWSTHAVPNNGGGTTYDVVINGTTQHFVNYDLTSGVINSLSIGSGQIFRAEVPENVTRTLTTGPLTLGPGGSFYWYGGGQDHPLTTGPITITGPFTSTIY